MQYKKETKNYRFWVFNNIRKLGLGITLDFDPAITVENYRWVIYVQIFSLYIILAKKP